MPIKNLTQYSEVGSGLPRLAKVHKGDKKTEANRPGKDLDHFRVVFEPEFADLQAEWEELYTDTPDCFERVYMTYPTVDEAFATWKEEWNASQTLLHRCDGDHQTLWYSEQAQAYSTAKEKCARSCACTNVGRLNLLVPEFIEIAGILGYVTVETHSINDILTVYRTLADVQRMNGTLLGVPFSLGRIGQQISAPDRKNKRRIKVNKSLFYLYPDPDFTKTVLLPKLTQSGGFLAPDQPALPPPAPTLDATTSKGLLNSGEGIRRLGLVESPTPLVVSSDPAPIPDSTRPAPAPAAQTIIGIDTVGNSLGKLKTRAADELFNKDHRAMNVCVSKLMQEGKLPPAMPIDQALEVIKAANCKPASASQKDFDDIPSANDKIEQAALQGMPTPLPV